jgi:hypothetical protein
MSEKSDIHGHFVRRLGDTGGGGALLRMLEDQIDLS